MYEHNIEPAPPAIVISPTRPALARKPPLSASMLCYVGTGATLAVLAIVPAAINSFRAPSLPIAAASPPRAKAVSHPNSPRPANKSRAMPPALSEPESTNLEPPLSPTDTTPIESAPDLDLNRSETDAASLESLPIAVAPFPEPIEGPVEWPAEPTPPAAAIAVGDIDEPETSLVQIAERLRDKAFRGAKVVNWGSEVKMADWQPTVVISVPDAGARAKRIRRKKEQDYISGFLDSVSTLNWENRVYVTAFPDENIAQSFVDERDGYGGVLAAFRGGRYVVWGDKPLVEKAKRHW